MPWIVDKLVGIPIALIGIFIGALGYVLYILITLILFLTLYIVDIAFGIQKEIFSMDVVIIGWSITRDLANLGFVLVIILIALATIVRFEEYRAQKLLPKLIFAAIIVNFSLEICRVILDFTQKLSNFFISKIAPFESLGQTLGALFSPQKLSLSVLNLEGGGDSLTAKALTFTATPYFLAALNLLMIFALLALSFMLLIRFFYLAFLLILAPIVWLFWVVPGLSFQFQKWWDSFLKWSFFAPAVSFFLYLAFYSQKSFLKFLESYQNVPASDLTEIIKGAFLAGAQAVLIGGLIIGGIITAQQMGITGAKGAINIAQKTGNRFKTLATKTGQTGSALVFGRGRGKEFLEKAQTLGQNRGVIGRTFSYPIRRAAQFVATQVAQGKEIIKAKEKEIQDKKLDELAARFNLAKAPEQVAILKRFSEENKKINNKRKERDDISNEIRLNHQKIRALNLEIQNEMKKPEKKRDNANNRKRTYENNR